jgi:hypothetical protein
LPVSAHALSDGLTEGVFFLLTATFLLVAVSAVRRRSTWRFALSGLLSGLAYLARPEGAALALVLGVLLIIFQLRPSTRWPWRTVTACGASLTITALLVASPYMIIIHGFTNKSSAKWIMEDIREDGYFQSSAQPLPSDADLALAEGAPEAAVTDAGMPTTVLFASFAPDWGPTGKHTSDLRWGAREFFWVLGKGFHYVVWVPALLGLWWFRQRIWQVPGIMVGGLLCLFYVPLLLRLAVVAGYISDRHSLIFVMCGSFWAVAGILELPRRLSALGHALRLPDWLINWAGHPRAAEVLCCTALIVWGLPSSLRPLHPTRLGFREAGFWLADHAEGSYDLCDPFCWSEFYAGKAFTPSTDHRVHTDAWHGGYVVLDRSVAPELDDVRKANHHSHLPELTKARQLARVGTLVYSWPTHASRDKALVMVYSVPATSGK